MLIVINAWGLMLGIDTLGELCLAALPTRSIG
jgi:hypothetical protein